MRVDLSRIIGVKNPRARDTIVDEIIAETDNDPPFISDLLVEHQTAEPLLDELRKDRRNRHCLHMKRDEWGEPPVPGEIVKRKHKIPLKTKEGLPIPSVEINRWKRAGIYEKKRYTYDEYTLDEKGCIWCNARDAEYFLSNWGVHSISGMPISYHAYEHSVEPAPCPNGGMKHVWYYRFFEQTKDMHEKLPVLTKVKKTG